MNKRQRLIIISLIIISAIPFYKVKTRMGVDILPGRHAPDLLEDWTGGLFKARWVDRDYVYLPHHLKS